MSDFKFPTQRQRGPSSYVAEVLKVYEGFNAKYGPEGKDGLFVKIRYESTGSQRDIFYPFPPAAKSDRFIEAINADLGLDLDRIGYRGLEGYVFRWANEEIQREINDRETGNKRMVTVRLEYPMEIIKAPEGAGTVSEASSTNNGTTPSTADWESFLDEVLSLADGKTFQEIRLAAAQSKAIRNYPKEFREKLTKGTAIDELKESGRLEETDGADGSVYKVLV